MSERVVVNMRVWPPFWYMLRRSLWSIPVSIGLFMVVWGVWQGAVFGAFATVACVPLGYLVARYRHYIVLHREWLDLMWPRRRPQIPYESVESVVCDESSRTLMIRWRVPKGAYGWIERSATLWPKEPDAVAAEIRRRVEAAKAPTSAATS